ncbi:MAG: hypothetical protein MZV64_72675 [Ignavibacteriales bacterium]|nr:hypothetical protein [Ignavibacteriales bacterium]
MGGSGSTPRCPRRRSRPAARRSGLVCFQGAATVTVDGQAVHPRPLRRACTSRGTRTSP